MDRSVAEGQDENAQELKVTAICGVCGAVFVGTEIEARAWLRNHMGLPKEVVH